MLPARGLRPSVRALRPVIGSRPWAARAARAATTAAMPSSGGVEEVQEEQEAGRFHVKPGEAILFFDNIFPPRLALLLGRRAETNRRLAELLSRSHGSTLGFLDPIQLVKRAIPESLPIEAVEIVPRLQDGGAFVKFRHDAKLDPADIEATLLKSLRDEPLKPWFNPFRGIRARLIRGTPWLEDLYRYPSSLVRVEFVPPAPGSAPEEIPEEVIYGLFRRYGRIADIFPQPSDSKVTPRYVNVGFSLARDAIMARNCMHGYVLDEAQGGGKTGTKLRLSYISRVKPHSVWNWLTSHPRIVIPIVAALLAGFSVLVFDPIRQFFIRVHVQQSLRFANWRLYRWLRSHAGFSFGGKKNNHNNGYDQQNADGLDTVWKHRRDLIDQLQSWLDGSSGTFIVVTGPRGSGKTEMVMKQALAGRKNVLYIDCKPVVDAGGDAGTIKRLAASVGYRPVFSWANGISSMIDLALQSTAGVKSGFTETLDSQVYKILQTTGQALKRVALSGRSKLDKDASISEDAYLEAHPENRPVIVLDNFLHKTEETVLVYEKLAEWAAAMVQNNVAHVVFLTSHPSYNKPLSKAMPDRVSRTLSFSDLDKDLARNFVISRLEELWKRDAQESDDGGGGPDADNPKPAAKRPDLSGLDACLETLGGRLTDLEFLARRLNAGQNPREATEEIVNENAADIVKIFLLGKTGADVEKRWSSQQAWYLIRALAEHERLRYNQVLLQPTFSSASGEAAVESLASTELVAIKTHRGRPQSVTPGKALHRASFQVLLQDRVLRAKMDLALLEEAAKAEAGKLAAVEGELQLLGGLPRRASETGDRAMYLLGKLGEGQSRIEGMEREMAALKKILNEEY